LVTQPMTPSEINELLSRALVGRLGMSRDNQPYVLPICFIHHDGKIFFHSAPKGRKLETIKTNPKVCFQVDEHRLVPSSLPCYFTIHYRSVLVFGKVRLLTDPKEKLKILEVMLNKYGDITKLAKPLDEAVMHKAKVEVGEISIEEITGKKNE